jgi:protein gp37
MSTGIEWTDETWNPVTGCTKVSPGCKNCYAETVAERFWVTQYGPGRTPAGRRRFTEVWTHPDRLEQPLRWRKPRRIFVNSMSDLFHEEVPFEFVDKVFLMMALAPQHTFQVLTKRPARMLQYFHGEEAGDEEFQLQQRAYGVALSYWLEEHRTRLSQVINCAHGFAADDQDCDDLEGEQTLLPLMNVWLGVSVEDQATADERIPLLLQTPAAVRFVSYEPALGPVTLSDILSGRDILKPLVGLRWVPRADGTLTAREHARLHWVIAGGESGKNARPAHPDWFRSVRDQCGAAGVPFFFKQWGAFAPPVPEYGVPREACNGRVYRVGKKAAGRELDGATWDQFPAVRA